MSDDMQVVAGRDAKLSPAARETLDELLADVRTRVVLEARRRIGDGTITAADIVDAFSYTSGESLGPVQRRFVRSRLLIVTYVGLAAIAGIGASIVAVLERSGTTSIFIAAIGLAFAVSSAFLGLISYSRSRRGNVGRPAPDVRATFIDLWISAESVVREIATKQLGASSNEVPFTQLLARLVKAGVLSESDEVNLRKALRARNAVMHSAHIPDGEVQAAGDELVNFLRSSLKLR